QGMLLIGLAVAGLCAYVAYRSAGSGVTEKKTDQTQQSKISQLGQWEPSKLQQTSFVKTPDIPTASKIQTLQAPQQGTTEDPLAKARQAPLLAGSPQPPPTKPAVAGPATPVATDQEQGSELTQRLHATLLTGSKATVLPHPEYTV